MMDAPAIVAPAMADLAAFARTPYVVEEAAGAPLGMVFDVARSLADIRALQVTVPAAGFPMRVVYAPSGRVGGGGYPRGGILAGSRIPEREHAEILFHIRARIADEAPRLKNFGIVVLPRQKASDAENALAGMGNQNPYAKTFANYVEGKKSEIPYTMFIREADGLKCIITASSYKLTMRELSTVTMEGEANYGQATSRDFHTWVNWHEVGHCLLGASEAHADAFGLLMLVREGGSRDMVNAVAAFREGVELTSPDTSDTYFTSQVAGWVSRAYEKLRGDEDFLSLDLAGVAQMAKIVADKLALSDAEREERMQVREALDAGALNAAHWVRNGNGKGQKAGLTAVSYREWIESNAGKDPVLARITDVFKRIDSRPETPTRFDVDAARFAANMRTLAASGDPTAKTIRAALEAPHAKRKFDHWKGPLVFESESHVAGKFFPVEARAEVFFSPDGGEFIARDPYSRKPIVAANAVTGDVRQIQEPEAPEMRIEVFPGR